MDDKVVEFPSRQMVADKFRDRAAEILKRVPDMDAFILIVFDKPTELMHTWYHADPMQLSRAAVKMIGAVNKNADADGCDE